MDIGQRECNIEACNYNYSRPAQYLSGQTQYFRVLPKDVRVQEGGEVILQCEIAYLSGNVQWTKDGFALAPEFPIVHFGDPCDQLKMKFSRFNPARVKTVRALAHCLDHGQLPTRTKFNYLFFFVADDFIELVRGNQDKNISNGLRAPLDKRQQSCTFVSLRVFFRSSSDDS
ncbi:unnamed protein product, partial [Nesidiocoris tenuis]